MVPFQSLKCIIQIVAIICCIQVTYCYDFVASGTINLTKDNGWSQFGAACVGYLETSNFSVFGGAAGIVNVEFTAPINAPNDTTYILVFYDDQTKSFPMVNNTDLTCQEKIAGPYKRLGYWFPLNPGITWDRTISLHQHIRTRWWYFYLANCDESLIFPPISFIYSYKDNKSDTEICIKPSGITTTTSMPINPTDTTTINGTSGDGGDGSTTSRKTETQKILMWILIGVIIIVVIALFIGFGINYINKQRKKRLSHSQSLLMDALNEKEVTKNEDPYDLLKKWSLQQYGQVLIDEKGYDDVEQWADLNESDLEQMGFKEGHSKKFIKKVKEHFMDVLVEQEVADNQTKDVDLIKEEMVENTEQNNEEEGYTNQ